MTYDNKFVGAYIQNERECVFRVWAPLLENIELVILDKTEVIHPMSKDDFGYWTIKINDLAPGAPYLFRLEGTKKLPDPASRWQPHGVHGPSALLHSSFPWSDDNWKGIAMSDMIIYELHIGTFSPAGTFEGIISRLP